MIKEGQDTSYYTGRDYDQVCSAYLKLLRERESLKNKLICRLTEELTLHDTVAIQKITTAINDIMP